MAPRAGPAKPAALLLCCLGAWLAAPALALSTPALPLSTPALPLSTLAPAERTQILRDLRRCSGRLLRDYKDNEKLLWENNTQKKYQLPCFTPGFEAANNISIILAHLKQIARCKGSGLNNRDMNYTIEQLEKLRYRDSSEPQVPTCTDTKPFEYKTYILEILEQFSNCMENIPGHSRKRQKSQSRLPCVPR